MILRVGGQRARAVADLRGSDKHAGGNGALRRSAGGWASPGGLGPSQASPGFAGGLWAAPTCEY